MRQLAASCDGQVGLLRPRFDDVRDWRLVRDMSLESVERALCPVVAPG